MKLESLHENFGFCQPIQDRLPCIGWQNMASSFHISGVLPLTGQTVQQAAFRQCMPSAFQIALISFPGSEHRSLQGSSVRETYLPGVGSHSVHGVQMIRGIFSTLTA